LTPDERFMRRVLALASRGAGETNPNPLVGCVVIRAGRIVGEGFHARAGGPHAEIEALRRAGPRARGATLYVNLEPCVHRGRTGPCVPALIEAGIARVVAAMSDPNPLVNGRGLRSLARAGVAVTRGVLEKEAQALNVRFATAARSGRPFILLKVAMTLDGRIATARGDSAWITGPAVRSEARALRRAQDGVLVGIETVLADDPLLLPQPRTARPFSRIILDTRLRLPLGSRLVGSAAPRAPLIVVTASRSAARRRALEARGARVIVVPRVRGRVSLKAALRALRRLGLWSLMVEGGGEVLGSFLHARCFDQLALFRGRSLLGGRDSRPAFGGDNPRRIAEALPLVRGRAPRGASYELWYPRAARIGAR
jgi:diaminohydroxyphosphoribosylaminopyrimidine deaminase / 5-amino-6-(5-phosphoribosylamino)uracil reductase